MSLAQLRASFVSVNLFSLLCDGNTNLSTKAIDVITKFGGPITYLIVYILVLFAFLVWFDSGSKLPRLVSARETHASRKGDDRILPEDVRSETEKVLNSSDPLRVMRVNKTFTGTSTPAVDDVSFGVPQNTVLALLGPNGAGKTSTFNIISE